MSYATIDSPVLIQALQVAGELQTWINETCEGVRYVVGVNANDWDLQVYVGPIEVWHSDMDDVEDLNTSDCQTKYIDAVRNLTRPFTPDENDADTLT